MTHEDMIAVIEGLPLTEKLQLLAVLERAIQREIQIDLTDTEKPVPRFDELRGILAMNVPDVADDWKDDHTDYLTKKYA